MDRRTEASIQRVIESIYENVDGLITIDDMAKTAGFSKFHFTRLFQRATGISPGRFLSAVRLQEAKKLLLTTSMSVTDITYLVGYNSVGTFSTRFKSSVGLSPTAYRELSGYTSHIADDGRRHGRRTGVVQGELTASCPEQHEGTVFVGLFPDTIPQGNPAKCAVLHGPGPFRLDEVPEGCWYLLAQCVRRGSEDILDGESPTVAARGPLDVRAGRTISVSELPLRPMKLLDPPVLMALLDARRTALSSAVG
jgi:AraC family transcriptional regulator